MVDNKKYPLETDKEYLLSLDMTREYTDEEILEVYDKIQYRNDPKQIDSIIKQRLSVGFRNPFEKSRKYSDEYAGQFKNSEDGNLDYLFMTGRISEEEWSKKVFIVGFRLDLECHKKDI